ncbi:MAG: hypothetical protein CMJ18_19800 [Phycisphaeraceae bacterium]|nr:hypothetical protein [Phycisphaeraceae bacterium]
MTDFTVWAYLSYLIVSILLTVWVARTLYRNGRIFLVIAFGGDESLADSINHLLIVGFYLINIGFVTLALRQRSGPDAADLRGAIEMLSTKVGIVLVVLGAMHFFNLYIFNYLRQRSEVTGTSGEPALLESSAD